MGYLGNFKRKIMKTKTKLTKEQQRLTQSGFVEELDVNDNDTMATVIFGSSDSSIRLTIKSVTAGSSSNSLPVLKVVTADVGILLCS